MESRLEEDMPLASVAMGEPLELLTMDTDTCRPALARLRLLPLPLLPACELDVDISTGDIASSDEVSATGPEVSEMWLIPEMSATAVMGPGEASALMALLLPSVWLSSPKGVSPGEESTPSACRELRRSGLSMDTECMEVSPASCLTVALALALLLLLPLPLLLLLLVATAPDVVAVLLSP